MDISQILDAFAKIVDLVTKNTASSLFSVSGLILILLAAAIGVFGIVKPSSLQPWHKWLSFVALGVGILLFVAGPGITLFDITENVIPRVSKDTALKRLYENTRVGWLIRLIPFDPIRQPELAINALDKLGPKTQKFTFVAPYDELRGVTVKDAVRRIGGSYADGMHVSAVIFPLNQADEGTDVLYPANARGLLQVVFAIEGQLTEGKFLLKKELLPPMKKPISIIHCAFGHGNFLNTKTGIESIAA